MPRAKKYDGMVATIYIDADAAYLKEAAVESPVVLMSGERTASFSFEAGPKDKQHVIQITESPAGSGKFEAFGLRSENKKMRLYEPTITITKVEDISAYAPA